MNRTQRDRRPPKKDYTTPDVIRAVREQPVLWDKQCEGYHKSADRAEAWACIASRFYDLSAKKACKVWDNARKALSNQRQRIAASERSGNAGKTKCKPYKYAEEMSFLKGNTMEVQQSNLESDSGDSTSDEEDADDPDDEEDDSDDEEDEDDDQENAVDYSIRQEISRKRSFKSPLKPINLNYQHSDTDGNDALGEDSDKENAKLEEAEKAKRTKEEKKRKAKQARQKKKDKKREDRLREIAARVRARAKSSPPQSKKVSEEEPNVQTMEVHIKEPTTMEQSPTTLFLLSMAGRLNALPMEVANGVTLPILQLVIDAENKLKQGLDHNPKIPKIDLKMQRVEEALHLPNEKVAIRGCGYELKGRDMHTLRPDTWLNDQIINMYLALIEKRSSEDPTLPSVKAFSTFAYPCLAKKGDRSILNTDGVDGKDLLLMPLHHPEKSHWSLIYVDLEHSCVTLYDSMKVTTLSAISHIDTVVEFLTEVIPSFNAENCLKVHETDGPEQFNGADCGVFLAMYAEQICRGRVPSFTQEDMPGFRKKIVYEILTQGIQSNVCW